MSNKQKNKKLAPGPEGDPWGFGREQKFVNGHTFGADWPDWRIEPPYWVEVGNY